MLFSSATSDHGYSHQQQVTIKQDKSKVYIVSLDIEAIF